MANKNPSSEIAVCSQTAELVQGLLPPEDLGLVTLRGRSGQEHVYGISREGDCAKSRLTYDPSYVGDRVLVTDFPRMIH